jgi:hypothetical protein
MKRWIATGIVLAALAVSALMGAATGGTPPGESTAQTLTRRRTETEQALAQCRLSIAQEQESIAAAQERLRRLQEKALLLEGAVAAFQEAERVSATPDSASKQPAGPAVPESK